MLECVGQEPAGFGKTGCAEAHVWGGSSPASPLVCGAWVARNSFDSATLLQHEKHKAKIFTPAKEELVRTDTRDDARMEF